MRIGIFGYNFEHKKTQEGLFNLFLNDYKPICVLAQDWKLLFHVSSGARVGLQDIKYTHPKIIAEKLGIDYINISHDECSKIIKELDLDIGVILGARILKKKVIDSFNIGVINMHPGILPDNRGLDNIKWAILNNLPQGVTTHLISDKIDEGFMIDKKCINVYLDDTLTEIMLRIQNREQIMMIDALRKLESMTSKEIKLLKSNELHSDNYNSLITSELDEFVLSKFYNYKKNYESVIHKYKCEAL